MPEQTSSLSLFQSPHLMGACYASTGPAFWQTIIRICLVTHGADQRMLQEVITIRQRAYVFFLLLRKSCLTTDCLHTRCLSSAHILHGRRWRYNLLKKMRNKNKCGQFAFKKTFFEFDWIILVKNCLIKNTQIITVKLWC